MATVYSTRFIQVHGLTSVATYTVPLGYVAVVRDLDAYINATGGSDLFLEGALSQAIFWQGINPGDRKWTQWQGRQVLMAGETLKVTVSVGSFDSWDVTVSGYLLTA